MELAVFIVYLLDDFNKASGEELFVKTNFSRDIVINNLVLLGYKFYDIEQVEYLGDDSIIDIDLIDYSKLLPDVEIDESICIISSPSKGNLTCEIYVNNQLN